MEKERVFTAFKKYSGLFVLGFLIILSGCQGSTEPINSETTGMFNHYLVYPFSFLLKFFASLFNGSYGLSIILITILIRVALMPMMVKQYGNQLNMKEKMALLQPELEKLKETYKDKTDKDAQMNMQKEMMELYKKYNVNPLAVGCLPMLIQFPILIGFYYAIKRTPEIASHSFLWFDLGHTDMILPIIAGIIYFIQFKVSQGGAETPQQQQLRMMGYLSPVLMAVFSFSAPAALPLYWSIGGTFMIIQTLVSKRIYKPRPQESTL